MNDDENKVVHINGNPDHTFTLKKGCGTSNFSNYCKSRCRNVQIDTDRRLLECRECHRVIDPFDYLTRWAKDTDNRLGYIESLKTDELKLKNMVAVLQKELKKLRGELRKTAPSHIYLTNPFALQDAASVHVVKGKKSP